MKKNGVPPKDTPFCRQCSFSLLDATVAGAQRVDVTAALTTLTTLAAGATAARATAATTTALAERVYAGAQRIGLALAAALTTLTALAAATTALATTLAFAARLALA